MSGPGKAISDGLVLAKRHLITIKRVPDLLVFSTIRPIIFVLLFGYVLGSAVKIPGLSYREYLMAGIFAQTVLIGSTITGTGLAREMQQGIVDRFRSLPVAPSAVLVGRTLSDLVNNAIVVAVMSLTGLLIGWRINTSVAEATLGFAILLLFSYAASWLMAALALSVSDADVFSSASFMVIFPLTLVANTFVGTAAMPGPLKIVAEWNPISAVTQATRELFGNTSPIAPHPDAWPLRHSVLTSLLWAAFMLLVFVPLAVRRYSTATSR